MTTDGSGLKVSVITVCLNAEDLIERTLRSVVDQTYPDIEYIVVDGGSKDKTLDIVKRYSEHIDVIVSEPDRGIYDAMNKGVRLATGEVVYFLNAGDYFHDSLVVSKVVEAFSRCKDCDILEGDIIWYGEKGQSYKSTQRRSVIGLVQRGVLHQAVFAKKELFDKYGLFDESFQVYGDLDWFVRCLLVGGAKVGHIDIPISYYLVGGASGTNRKRRFYEKTRIYDRYCSMGMILRHAGDGPLEALALLGMRAYYRLRLFLGGPKANGGQTRGRRNFSNPAGATSRAMEDQTGR